MSARIPWRVVRSTPNILRQDICSRCFLSSLQQGRQSSTTAAEPARRLFQKDFFHHVHDPGLLNKPRKPGPQSPVIDRNRIQTQLESQKVGVVVPKSNAEDPTTSPSPAENGSEPALPLDASSKLSNLSSTLPKRSLRRLLTAYLSLSKPRLTFLIVLTATSAYSLYPVPPLLLPSATATPSLSALTLLFLTAGTALSSSSANALNMLLEPEHDAKMSRTRNRPLVRGLIRARGALIFALITGVLGVGALYIGTNPTVAGLGLANIFLYAGVYTPLKRVSVLNTWVGAVVGAIPPLMGWVAAAGQSASSTGTWQELLFGEGSAGGWVLAALLYAWQFPHFNALSHMIKDEYRNAGYRMLTWVNPKMNGRVAFRYAVLMFPICGGLCWAGVTDWGYLVTSSVLNGWVVREAWRFWRKGGAGGSARGLFWASIGHLPGVMVLAMLHKQGLWEGLWKSAVGELDEDDDDEELAGVEVEKLTSATVS